MQCLRLAGLPGVILTPQLFRCHFNKGIELAVCLHLLMDLKRKAVVSENACFAPASKLHCRRRLPGQHRLALEGIHRRIAHGAQLQPGAHQGLLLACFPFTMGVKTLQLQVFLQML